MFIIIVILKFFVSFYDNSIFDFRCNENKSKYICPKCNIAYCSIECYKSSAHLECSENFYKQCVEEELKAQHNNSELKKRTLDMLQRIYNQEVHEDFLSEIMQEDEEGSLDLVGEEELDSDDENVELFSLKYFLPSSVQLMM